MGTTEPVLIDGQWRPAERPTGSFRAFDPLTGQASGPVFPISGAGDVESAMSAALAAAAPLAAASPASIAAFLDAYANAIDADGETLVALAHGETALPVEPRLRSVELPRASGQLRQAAAAVRAQSWTQPTIDTRSGLRACRGPLGKPVLVFGPNNFPFAFNAIAGSDFASAIAARNPVIAKAHPAHPATSRRLAELAHAALRESGLPLGAVQMIYHIDNELGSTLAGDSRLGAIAFTGSRYGGLALKSAADVAGVPMYAEMSSVNPVFLLPGALAERGVALAEEFFQSCMMGSGQFCTNPGILVVPDSDDGDAFVDAARQHFIGAPPKPLFSEGGRQSVLTAIDLLRHAGARVAALGKPTEGDGFHVTPVLLDVDDATFLRNAEALQTEAFGPVSLVIRAGDVAAMALVAASLDGNLTGTIYRAADGSDDAAWATIAAPLRARVGRLIANRMPTGVAVSAAMNHGGPYPSSSNAGFTAVGMPGAILRFTALHSYDNLPDILLPEILRNRGPEGMQRLVDGAWTEAVVGGAA